MLGATKPAASPVQETVDEKPSSWSFYGKLAVSAIAGCVVIYYGGPVAAISARSVYDQLYVLQYGALPGFFSTEYWKYYMPWREHIGAKAYEYGPTLIGGITAPIAYKIQASVAGLVQKKKTATTNALPPLTPNEPILVAIPKEQPKEQVPVKEEPCIEKDELEALIKQLMAIRIDADNSPSLGDSPAKTQGVTPPNNPVVPVTFLFAEKEVKQTIEPEVLPQIEAQRNSLNA